MSISRFVLESFEGKESENDVWIRLYTGHQFDDEKPMSLCILQLSMVYGSVISYVWYSVNREGWND